MNKKHLVGAATIAVLALPASAGAHVTLQPNSVPAGTETVESVRVPNELDNAATVKIAVQLPPGFAEASYQAVPGWTVKVKTQKLATPIQTDDGPVTEQVSQLTWSADSKSAGIQPGQFQDFPVFVLLPGKAGSALTFKAVQTYSNGKVVRWIGAPDSDTPAPKVALSAPVAAHAAKASSSSDGASKGLGIAALIVGALGLIAGATALVGARKK